MMTSSPEDEDNQRRLAALTATLVNRGALPAFYRIPPKQAALTRKLQRTLGPLLGDVGSSLLSGLDSGALSPANGLQVDAALTADAEIVGNSVHEAYQTTYLDAAQSSFERQARSILDRSGIEVTWELVEPRAVEVVRDLSFQASKRLMERITGDVKGVLLRSVEEGLGTKEIGDLLRDEIRDL